MYPHFLPFGHAPSTSTPRLLGITLQKLHHLHCSLIAEALCLTIRRECGQCSTQHWKLCSPFFVAARRIKKSHKPRVSASLYNDNNAFVEVQSLSQRCSGISWLVCDCSIVLVWHREFVCDIKWGGGIRVRKKSFNHSRSIYQTDAQLTLSLCPMDKPFSHIAQNGLSPSHNLYNIWHKFGCLPYIDMFT